MLEILDDVLLYLTNYIYNDYYEPLVLLSKQEVNQNEILFFIDKTEIENAQNL